MFTDDDQAAFCGGIADSLRDKYFNGELSPEEMDFWKGWFEPPADAFSNWGLFIPKGTITDRPKYTYKVVGDKEDENKE